MSQRFKVLASAVLLLAATACGGPQGETAEPLAKESGDEAAEQSGSVAEKVPVEAQGNPSTDVIPRSVFFGNPDRANVQISPDGKHLSWLAEEGGVLNVWVAPRGDLSKARAVTKDKTRPVTSYFWAYTGEHILYLQDKGGDENYHVYVVDLEKDETRDLTPQKGIKAQIAKVSHKKPYEIVVGINDRKPQLHDLYRIDIRTGEKKLIEENPGFVGYKLDRSYNVKLAMKMTPDGGMTIYKKSGDKKKAAEDQPLAGWAVFAKIPQTDTLNTSPIGFDRRGRRVYMWDSRGRNTSALTSVDLRTGKSRVLAEHPKADGSDIFIHPTKRTVLAVGFTHARREWKILDRSLKKHFAKISKVADGEPNVVGATLDMNTWVLAYLDDDGPLRYYLYDRKKKEATFLFTNREALEDLELAEMHPKVIESRDGLELVNYLTLPPQSDPDGDGEPSEAQPMVLLVHGGPWARDSWGYNSLHQLLANRGYAVLSVNYRGSTGFGKEFVNAGNKEWAGKMHNDLIDSVDWAVEQKIAQEDEVCIMGGSYGGYATLVGLTMTPEVFACGVDIVGPSSILTLLETIPPYWKPMQDLFKVRVGDWTTEEGKKMLVERSPLTHVDQIERPLLIGQGANDPRVKQAESDQIVEAMQKKGIPVSYVLFPDEGHGFARKPNRLAFFAAAEAFLSAHLGGVYQPAEPSELEGTTMKVPAGVYGIPGFPSLMQQMSQ